MSIRKFWLKNGNGEIYQLTNASLTINLYNPVGLGFVKEIQFLRIGNRNKPIQNRYDLPRVEGNLVFGGTKEEQYENYNEFLYFASKTPLTLYQQTPNTTKSFYIECIMAQLDKGDVNEINRLECYVVFLGTTFWKSGEKNILNFEKGTSQDGKFYPLQREYSYSGSGYTDMPIINKNTATSPFVFEIIGEVENPILSFYQNNEKYGVIKLLGTFDYVRVNTESDKQELYLEREGLPLSNPMSYQDLTIYDGKSDLTFFDLRAGNNLLTFNASNEEEFDGQLKLTWEDEFVSV